MRTLTVRQIYDAASKLAGTAGVCDPQNFMERLDRAGQFLMSRIDADGMMWMWRLCPCGNCIVLPSSIRSVRQAWIDGDPVDLRSEFWHGRLSGGLNESDHQEIPWKNFVDSGRRVATQRLVMAQKNEVFELKSYELEDGGKQIQIHFQGAGNDVRVWDAELSKNAAPVYSKPEEIGEVLRFQKPRTKGNVELWVMNLETQHRRLLATYSAHDEVPSHAVYEMSGRIRGALNIKGKREWISPRSMDDMVYFGNIEAWGSALQAEAAWSNGDQASKEQFLAFAVGSLAIELRDVRPHGQGQTVQTITPFSIMNQRRGYPRFHGHR